MQAGSRRGRSRPSLAPARAVQRPSLGERVVATLSRQILSGRLAPGAQLPTEHAIATAHGVSRTVVREAVARLKAEGLVRTRQGQGAFVVHDADRPPFRLDEAMASSIADALRVMQLRMAVEIEAAGVAAEQRRKSDLEQMQRALARFDVAIAKGEVAVKEDFELHRAIAAATGNRYFVRFLDFLGHFIIPRWTIQRNARGAAEQRAYLAELQKEHRKIVAGIAAGRPAAARRAMRAHLARSRRRYEAMAAALRNRHDS